MTRVRKNSRNSSSTPASLNASSVKTADSTDSSRIGEPHAKSPQPVFHIGGGIPRGNGGLLAPTQKRTNQQGSILEKFLSKSNPSSGGGGVPQSKYLRDNPLVSPQNSSRVPRPKSTPSVRFGGMVRKDDMPSFLHKFATPPIRPGSRPPNHAPTRQTSFPEPQPRKSPRMRNRSYTEPIPPLPPNLHQKKSSLMQLPPSLGKSAPQCVVIVLTDLWEGQKSMMSHRVVNGEMMESAWKLAYFPYMVSDHVNLHTVLQVACLLFNI